jgi:hypothetical protein
MKTFCFAFISCIIFQFSNAQTDHIQSIKEHYYSVNEDNYLFHELELNYVYAAIGEQTKKFKFWFSSEQSDPENDPYEMNYTLAKVEISFNISASLLISLEYLYDSAGHLLFFYEKIDGYESSEKRLYFNNNKLIKSIVKDNRDEVKQDYTHTSNFKEADLELAEVSLSKAGKMLHFFSHINEGGDLH